MSRKLVFTSAIVGMAGLAATAAVPEPAAIEATTTQTLMMPPRETDGVGQIYASVLIEGPSATEYILACTPKFEAPYPSSCKDFTGVTLTHGVSTMRIEIGDDTYDCHRDEEGTYCAIQVNGVLQPVSTIEAEAWFTPVAVIKPTEVSELGNLELLKRQQNSDESSTTTSTTSTTSTSSTPTASGARCPARNDKRSPQRTRGGSSGSDENRNDEDCSGAGMVRPELLATTTGFALATALFYVVFAL